MHKDWFFYDWNMDGEPAEFAVNMELSGAAPFDTHPVLLYVRCGMRDEGDLNRRALRHIASIEKKCMKRLDPLYAGFIRDAPPLRHVFFTSPSASSFRSWRNSCKRNGISTVSPAATWIHSGRPI